MNGVCRMAAMMLTRQEAAGRDQRQMAGHCQPLHGDEWRLHDAHPPFTSRWTLRVIRRPLDAIA